MTNDANELARAAWNANAAYWDNYMGDDGTDYVNYLIWPATQRLLDIRPDTRILDIACGNGLYARRVAALGANVTAFDFSAAMLAKAQKTPYSTIGRIDYREVDATDREAVLSLGEAMYDAAMCHMALFDMADIAPLLQTLPRLLKPGGLFVFSILHPVLNGAHVVKVAEQCDEGGDTFTRYSLRIEKYLTPRVDKEVALRGQPWRQPYFHRPLHQIFGACFHAGFVMDALEEPSFPTERPQGSNPFSRGTNYSEFPPVLIARMRPIARE